MCDLNSSTPASGTYLDANRTCVLTVAEEGKVQWKSLGAGNLRGFSDWDEWKNYLSDRQTFDDDVLFGDDFKFYPFVTGNDDHVGKYSGVLVKWSELEPVLGTQDFTLHMNVTIGDASPTTYTNAYDYFTFALMGQQNATHDDDSGTFSLAIFVNPEASDPGCTVSVLLSPLDFDRVCLESASVWHGHTVVIDVMRNDTLTIAVNGEAAFRRDLTQLGVGGVADDESGVSSFAEVHEMFWGSNSTDMVTLNTITVEVGYSEAQSYCMEEVWCVECAPGSYRKGTMDMASCELW